MRSGRATVPCGTSANTDSCLAGPPPAAHPQLGRTPAKMRSKLTAAEIAMSGSYFHDVLLDPRRYGIENTTDKVRRPGAVRLRCDAVGTEHVVSHPEAIHMDVEPANRRCGARSG